MAVSNESMRITTLDMTKLYAIHERAARVGGRGIFLLFFAINFGLIGVCLRLVRRGLSRP